ncbi:hypothetical protein TNCV_841681 [Trichonephila clavipes]|nr:hypothetical protein TNCV_841681 [Trichonephila clavipes]
MTFQHVKKAKYGSLKMRSHAYNGEEPTSSEEKVMYAVSSGKTWVVERGNFYDPVRSLLKSKNQDINRLQLAVKLPWAIFFESVDILS